LEKFGFIDSKFRFAILAAKRAKQLVNGSKKKIDYNAENPLSIAMQELSQGKVNFKILSAEELELLEANYGAPPPIASDNTDTDDLLFSSIDTDDNSIGDTEDEEDEEESDN
jgi:DNA-directed RNA polymerase subunit omega